MTTPPPLPRHPRTGRGAGLSLGASTTRRARIRTATALVALAAAWAPTPAAAQSRPALDDHLALAQVCASEAGLDATPEECAAIATVLRRTATRRGLTLAAAALAYSTRVFDPNRRDPRAWLAHLRPDGAEPSRWPTTIVAMRGGLPTVLHHAPWSGFRARWLRLYEAAGRVLEGRVESPCETPPDHWGMRSGIDLERARRAGWTEVACGPTRNAFWRVPPRSISRAAAAGAAATSSADSPRSSDTSGATAPP